MKDRSPIQSSKQTYRRLLHYVYPYRVHLLAGTIFGIVFGASHIGLIQSFRSIISNFFNNTDLTLHGALVIAAMLPLFGFIWGLGGFFSKYLVGWVGERVVMDLRIQTFSQIQRFSLDYFTHHKIGELISRTTNDTMMVQRAVSNVLVDLVREPFTLVAMVFYIIWTNPRLAMISLIAFPICILPAAIFGRRVRRLSKEGQEKLAELVSIIQENIMGIRIVKAFCTEDRERDRFLNRAQSVFRRAVKISIAQNMLEPIVVLIAMGSLSIVFLYAWKVGMAIDELIAFAAMLFVMYQPVKKLSRIHLQIQQCSSSADRIFEILDAGVCEKDTVNAIELADPIREIMLKNICFQYDDTPVLKNINLTVRAGDCIALVGSSGAGKTTLMNLIPRFYDLNTGQLLINGKDITSLSIQSLRQQIGLVTQETILFNDTVANTIAYAKPDVTHEKIIEAAKMAQAHEFIMDMPDGYDTKIGDRGLRLSGGQRQRLSIARAILADRPVLLLDEATSALDTHSERCVQAALDELMKNRTVIMIAHRLSTIKKANRIMILSEGSIVEEGTHEELMNRGGHYKYLYDL